jgi:hypothetical protein
MVTSDIAAMIHHSFIFILEFYPARAGHRGVRRQAVAYA